MDANATFLITNIVFRTVLTEVDEFARRGKLPVPATINVDSVERFENRKTGLSGHVYLTNGWSFSYDPGGVNTFESPHSPLGALRKGVRIRGPAHLTLDDATERAREFIRDLGVPLEEVFMDLPPEVQTQEGWSGLKWADLSWQNPT